MIPLKCLADIYDGCCNCQRVPMLFCDHLTRVGISEGFTVHSTAFSLGSADTDANPNA